MPFIGQLGTQQSQLGSMQPAGAPDAPVTSHEWSLDVTIDDVVLAASLLISPLGLEAEDDDEDHEIGGAPEKKVTQRVDTPAVDGTIEVPELAETRRVRQAVESALRRVAVDIGQLPILSSPLPQRAETEPEPKAPEPLVLAREFYARKVDPEPEEDSEEAELELLAAQVAQMIVRRRSANRARYLAAINQYLKERA